MIKEIPPRIIVVGGGIVGSSIALHCISRLKNNVNVILIDDGKGGATRRSWGLINSFWKTPFNYHILNRMSVQLWPRYLKKIQYPKNVPKGSFLWAECSKSYALLNERLGRAQKFGHCSRKVFGKEKELMVEKNTVPGIIYKEPLYNEDEMVVDAKLATSYATKLFKEMGGIVRVGRVEKVATNGNYIHLEGGEDIYGDIIVVAAGCGTRSLLNDIVDIPVNDVQSIPTYCTWSDQITPIVPELPFLCRISCDTSGTEKMDFFMTYHGLHRAVLDGIEVNTEHKALDVNKDDLTRKRKDAWKKIVPNMESWESHSKVGTKPMPMDDQTIIGFINDSKKIYVCVTHSGVTLAPLLGDLASIEIVDGINVELLNPYRLSRFRKSTSLKDSAKL